MTGGRGRSPAGRLPSPGGGAISGEAALVARAREGDLTSYAALVRSHADVAVRWARLCGAGDDAEDVAQEAFVKAYAALPRFRSGLPFRPWLLRIVRNESLNARRSAARRAGRDTRWSLDGPVAAPDPAVQAEASERHTALWSAVRALPEDQRLVVTCRYLLELDEAETAGVLGLPRGTVKSRLSRGLARLRALAEGGELG